jgi:hypothetical protein
MFVNISLLKPFYPKDASPNTMKSQKTLSLMIILSFAITATLVAHPAEAASNPSVPTFTVQYVDHSYDVPPTYKIEPYTGQTVVDQAGYHVDKRTLDVTIQNQAFTSFKQNGNDTALYYYIRHKGHFEDWPQDAGINYVGTIQADTSASTLVSFPLEYWNIPAGGQVDFQVKAAIGYSYTYITGLCGESTSNSFVSLGQSDWSSTRTITIDNPIIATPTPPPYLGPTQTASPYSTTTPAPNQNPTATPTLPETLTHILFGTSWEQPVLVVMTVVIIILAIALVLVLWRKSNRR